MIRRGNTPALWPVIEVYRSSPLSAMNGNTNDKLNRMSVFTELKPWYFGSATENEVKGAVAVGGAVAAVAGNPALFIPDIGLSWRIIDQLTDKHVASLYGYMHCMKWLNGPSDATRGNAPSCRMSTADLKQKCSFEGGALKSAECPHKWVQKGDDGAYTTWDYDDEFDELPWEPISTDTVPDSSAVPAPTCPTSGAQVGDSCQSNDQCRTAHCEDGVCVFFL